AGVTRLATPVTPAPSASQPGWPGELERHETPDPARSDAVNSRFHGVRRQADGWEAGGSAGRRNCGNVVKSAAWAQEAAKEVAAAVATVRVLAIIGSGETSPTMVTAHRELIARLGLTSPQAIVLATPYAFQENAADVSARTQHYFADSVGLQVRVAAGTSPNADPAMAPPLIPPDEEDEAR